MAERSEASVIQKYFSELSRGHGFEPLIWGNVFHKVIIYLVKGTFQYSSESLLKMLSLISTDNEVGLVACQVKELSIRGAAPLDV